MLFDSIYETIGKTPIVKLNNLGPKDGADIYLKLESFNPSGSVKDRASLYMVEGAEREGILKENGTIIEATSGNTGIGLSMIGASKGYRVIIVMPDTMSVERRNLMKGYGAEIILTDGADGMLGSVELAAKLAKENNYFMPSQFANINNKIAHYETTAMEILEDMEGDIDAFVAGVGTGGTISGVGKKLKELRKDILIVAAQPEKSPVLTNGTSGPHGIQGLGANFIPEIYDENVVDEIVNIKDEDALKYARLLGKKEGILAGISSGANFAAASIIAKQLGEGHRVLTLLPDTGERYLSTLLFNGE